MKYKIKDKETGEPIKDIEFDTLKEAKIWCEENGIDYDYWEISLSNY